MALDFARAYIAKRQAELTAARKRVRSFSTASFTDFGPMAKGHLVVETRAVDATGSPAGPWTVHEDDPNLVVTQAERIMAQMAIQAANSGLGYVELGDPTFPANPPTLADTALQQTTGVRKAGVATAAGNVVTVIVDFLAGEANGNIYTEAGLFNGILGSGLMFARKVFAPITKTASFEMRFTWFITFLVNTQGSDCSGIALIGPSTVTAFTIYLAGDVGVGGQLSAAANFDFAVGANNVDVFLRGQRLLPGVDYQESATLNATVLGPPSNKGVNFTGGLALIPGDEVFLIHRAQA